jgi:Phosphatidylserine/phosphatidylglycerophosphate/cardiolipin synthases and related enzymes
MCLQFLLNFISGVPVRMKKSPFLMHHKFLVIDKNILISGSSNWTSTAFAGNWDNIIVTSLPALVMPFSQHFSQLWKEFSEMDHKLQV